MSILWTFLIQWMLPAAIILVGFGACICCIKDFIEDLMSKNDDEEEPEEEE